MQPVDDRGRAVEKLLAGRYEVLGFLGHGGFASVYQVRSVSLQRFEALKVLLESHGEDSDFARRFRQEARVAASLEHPGIVKIHDTGHVGGTLWYSMQFVDGRTLKEELATRGAFDAETGARIAVPLLDALDYSHARGVIHRDVKPDNVLLDQRGRPFLMDFGIAKAGDSLVRTLTGYIVGSPAYLSPEQLRGQRLDGRTDVFSLGVMLYQMLSGVLPFPSESIAAVERRLTEDAPALSSKCPGVSGELEHIVHRALARDRDARYASAAEMRDDLESFLADAHPRAARERPASGESSSRGRTAAATTSPASESRRPAWLWPAAGAFALAALAGVLLLTRGCGLRAGAVRAAAEKGAVARHELVNTVGEGTRKGQREKTSEGPPARQQSRQPLGGGRAAPRLVAGPDELHGFPVSAFGDPRKALAHARALKRDELDDAPPVPRGDEADRPHAEPAVAVVDERVGRPRARAHVERSLARSRRSNSASGISVV